MAYPARWTLLLACFASSFACIASLSADAAASDEPMNVLFIVSDDLRTDLGSYGHPLAQTPNLDRLGAQGVRFERAYCQYPLCNPSRSSMLTGRYPTTTNLYGNREWFGATYPNWVSLPRHFRDQGYVTLRSGKIFHGGIDDTEAWTEGGEARRWENPVGTPEVRARTPITPAEERERVAQMVAGDVQRAPSSDRWEAVEGDTSRMGDTVVTDRAIDYLRRAAGRGAVGGGVIAQPFFLAMGLSKPHSPLVAPSRFFDLYDVSTIPLPPDFAPRPTVPEGFPAGSIRAINADLFIRRDASEEQAREMIRAYLACVSYVDWNVGRVLAELDALGLRENTIVVFWSDHGYQLGEKGKWSKAGSLWEQGARVPFIVHDPRRGGNGTASSRVVQAIDIYPTLVDLCGLPIPDGLDGTSLRPLLDDPGATWNRPAFTFWNERGRGVSGAVIRTERWRYAEFFGPGAGAMLIDPVADPHELRNLAHDPAHGEVVSELSALLRAPVAGKTEASP
jgi:arylsulfatase A-like enzyme